MRKRKNIKVDLGEGHIWGYNWKSGVLTLPWCYLTGKDIDQFAKTLIFICAKRKQDARNLT